MSDLKPRLHDDRFNLDIFEAEPSAGDRPAIRQGERTGILDLNEAEAVDDRPEASSPGSGAEPPDDGLARPPDGALDLGETDVRAATDDSEFNPEAADGKDTDEPGDELEFQLEERPDLSFDPPDDEPDLVSSQPDAEIGIASDTEAGEPELVSSAPDEEITIVFDAGDAEDDLVSSVPEGEGAEVVLAEDSPGSPVEPAEPPEEPEPGVGPPAPDSSNGDDAPELPFYRTVADPPFELSASRVEPEYELRIDLDDEDDDGGE